MYFKFCRYFLKKFWDTATKSFSFLFVFVSFYISRYQFSKIFRTSFNIPHKFSFFNRSVYFYYCCLLIHLFLLVLFVHLFIFIIIILLFIHLFIFIVFLLFTYSFNHLLIFIIYLFILPSLFLLPSFSNFSQNTVCFNKQLILITSSTVKTSDDSKKLRLAVAFSQLSCC